MNTKSSIKTKADTRDVVETAIELAKTVEKESWESITFRQHRKWGQFTHPDKENEQDKIQPKPECN
jgi:hypothetical protein